MNNQIFLTLLVFALTCALINAQTSPSNCVYNGIDYSGFSNTNNSWSFVAPRGASTVTYYWNVCKAASKCSSLPPEAAVCQYQLNYQKQFQYYSIGDLRTGTFTDVDVGVGIKYTTSYEVCKNGNFRTTTVVLICDPNKENSVVSAQENPVGSCLYQVILSGKSACRNNSTSTTGSTSSPSTTGTTTGTTTSPSGFNNVQTLCFTKLSNDISIAVTFNDGYVQYIDNYGINSKACVDYNDNMQACFESNPNGNELCVTYNGGQPVCETIDGKASRTCLKASHPHLSSKPTIKKNGNQVHIDFASQDSSSSSKLMINSLFILFAMIVVSLY
ncbi:hypothetical protein CYY_009987 [Polysphondylium violaceum]|uniref:MRH domain-containing protein n=1 Tax=Polysphondylium violaceum TaxID=133409 RepID=A0A8J4PKV6_9MYCE|nr:hypothetical protein CYY_009987 [Polysphondylium violaceum]